jgi:hypothetical protein
MLVSDVINLSAKRMDLDVDDYDQQVMILHINSGIARVNNGLIKANDPLAITTLAVTGATPKPSDFFKTLPGYPVTETGTTLTPKAGAPTTVNIKYYTTKARLTTVGDTIPLPDYCIGELVDYVCIHLQNDLEANVTQDTALATSDEALLFAAKGG